MTEHHESPRLTKELSAALTVVDECPDGIHAFLRDSGIRGDLEVPSSCALAQWLRQRTNAACSVGTTSVYATRGLEWAESFFGDKVKTFVEEFDRNDHPDLVRDPNNPEEG